MLLETESLWMGEPIKGGCSAASQPWIKGWLGEWSLTLLVRTTRSLGRGWVDENQRCRNWRYELWRTAIVKGRLSNRSTMSKWLQNGWQEGSSISRMTLRCELWNRPKEADEAPSHSRSRYSSAGKICALYIRRRWAGAKTSGRKQKTSFVRSTRSYWDMKANQYNEKVIDRPRSGTWSICINTETGIDWHLSGIKKKEVFEALRSTWLQKLQEICPRLEFRDTLVILRSPPVLVFSQRRVP